ncbi:DNA mismatch repair protein MutS2 [Singulisphaera sp. GP187]|uniref:endonuclease MutS2 n=1 Tax=Singulisphaera sp. GP187 TaxID=1882752 RepID=UPI000926522D|nr:DNA strand exchange inhibitor protein [Singulisphaera sp. GP187]SIO60066.1 DNA mismatch repair protein MutS2 [Singulisphaera sp. GP187]
MDTHTLELLEFDKVRALVAKRAACSLGKERAWRMEPSRDPGEIRSWQALTTEMLEALSSGLTPPFGGLHDIRPQVRRAQIGAMLDAEELAQSVETLRAIGHLNQWLERIGEEFPRLGGLKQGVGEFSGVVNAIEGCLDSRGNVLDTASRKLSALRREIGQVEERIQETLRRMLRSNEIKRILRFPNFTMVGHHYVLPIAKEHRGEIQGSVHRTSASNETVYIEPQAIAEHSAQLSFIRAREAKEIRRILRWLSAQLGQVAESALGSLETLGELDLIHARGRYSLDGRMTPPDFNEEGKLVLRGARHPLLEAFFRGDTAPPRVPEPPREAPTESNAPDSAPPPVASPQEPRTVVPIDVHLGLQFQTLVVTGPNTGGKTVAIKTVGLLAIMAQAGLHIPAHQGSQLPVFDEVLADIGDEQSLEQSLSTFSSHVRRVTEILARATAKSLVLLDEMGAGTDPAEGAALGRAILDEIDSIGARAIVTTHLGDLKTYAFSNPRVENAAVEFDLETLRPRYRLHIGDIGQSNALQIARRLSLPEHIVTRAAKYLAQGRGQDLPELAILQKLRKDAEDARQAALTAQSEAERTREALNQRLTDLQREAENDERLADARARLQPGDRVVVPKFGYDRPGRVVKLDPRKKTAVVAIGQMQWDVAISELIPQTMRTPEVAAPAKAKSGVTKNAPRLEDFADEPSR